LRLDELQFHPDINNHIPELIAAAREVASPMLRKMATLGGNILCENRCSFYNQSEWWRDAIGYCLKCDGDICIATGGRKACFSKFVSDTAPVLIAAGAQIEYHTLDGATAVDLETIYTGDGIHPRNIPETALLSRIFIPISPDRRIIFKKLRPREAVDFTSLTTAVALTTQGNLRIVIGGMDPKPVCVEAPASASREDYIKKALARTRAVDNDYYSRNYRREMLRVFLEDSFDELGLSA
jgi:4-hydroxybenzoyl-CoA reductase subunit beta